MFVCEMREGIERGECEDLLTVLGCGTLSNITIIIRILEMYSDSFAMEQT